MRRPQNPSLTPYYSPMITICFRRTKNTNNSFFRPTQKHTNTHKFAFNSAGRWFKTAVLYLARHASTAYKELICIIFMINSWRTIITKMYTQATLTHKASRQTLGGGNWRQRVLYYRSCLCHFGSLPGRPIAPNLFLLWRIKHADIGYLCACTIRESTWARSWLTPHSVDRRSPMRPRLWLRTRASLTDGIPPIRWLIPWKNTFAVIGCLHSCRLSVVMRNFAKCLVTIRCKRYN